MMVVGAESIGHGKWHALLACGHECILDSGVTSPKDGEVTCHICQYDEQHGTDNDWWDEDGDEE